MFMKIHKRMKGQKGFTLIELLVVIIIIAILAAIAIPTFLGQRQKAQDASAKSLVRNAMTAIESAYVDAKAFDNIKDEDLAAIEPSITFKDVEGCGELEGPVDEPAGDMDASQNQVGWHGISPTSYEVGTCSQSGKTFGVVVNKGAEGGNTFYINGASQAW